MKNPEKQALKTFEKLEKQFKGYSDNHFMFWEMLVDYIKYKLEEMEPHYHGEEERS